MIELRLLGTLEIEGPDGAPVLSLLSQPKRVGILAYLAAETPGGVLRRDTLMALFWPEADERHARGSLRQALHLLRRSLGEGAVLNQGDDAVGLDTALFRCDVVEFEAAFGRGDPEAALREYRGDFLAGFHLDDAPDFERWVENERERLREKAVSAAETLRDEAAARGVLPRALELARRALEIAPGNGRAAHRLVELLALAGDRAGALRAYDSFAERLDQDFGLHPSPALQQLVDRIRAGEGVAGPGPTPPPAANRAGPATPGSPPSTPVVTPPPPEGRAAAPAVEPRHETVRGPAGSPTVRTLVGGLAGLALVAAVGLALLRGEGSEQPLRVLVAGINDPSPEGRLGAQASWLAEEITAALARSRAFAPFARGSVDGGDIDPARARADLQADYLVGGTIRPLESGFRISVQLISTESQLVVWMDHFDRPVDAGPGWDERVAAQVLSAMERSLLPSRPGARPIRRTHVAETPSEEAYFAYWEGRALWHQRQPLLFLRALDYFRDAVRLDPDYAAAFAAIADVYNLLGAYDYGVLRPRLASPAAADSALRAIELDPDLAEAWAALGSVRLTYDWDLDAARSALERALALDPEYPAAHHWYSLLRLVEGRPEESQSHVEQARALDPPSPVMRTALARHHYYRGAHERAVELYRESTLLDPDFPPARAGLGLTFALDGRFDDAAEQYRLAEAILGPAPLVIALQGHLAGLRGDTVGARAALTRLDGGSDWVPSEYRAIVHVALGESDLAIAHLERAYQEQSGAMVFLHVDPMLDALRDEPRFRALVRRVGVAGADR